MGNRSLFPAGEHSELSRREARPQWGLVRSPKRPAGRAGGEQNDRQGAMRHRPPCSRTAPKGLPRAASGVAVPLAFFCTLFFRHRKKSVSAPWDGKSHSRARVGASSPPAGVRIRQSWLFSPLAGGFFRGKQSARPALPCAPLVVCLNSGSFPPSADSPLGRYFSPFPLHPFGPPKKVCSKPRLCRSRRGSSPRRGIVPAQAHSGVSGAFRLHIVSLWAAERKARTPHETASPNPRRSRRASSPVDGFLRLGQIVLFRGRRK